MKQVLIILAIAIGIYMDVPAQSAFIAEYETTSTFDYGLRDIHVHPNGEVLMLVTSASPLASGYICSVDSDGTLPNCASYSVNGFAGFYSWDFNLDQEVFIVYRQSSGISYPNQFIAKLDADGDVEWSKRINMDLDFTNYTIVSVSASSDGGVFINMRSSESSSSSVHRQTIMFLDAAGELLWHFSKGDADGVEGLQPVVSESTIEGDLYTVSRLTGGASEVPRLHIMKITGQGNLAWENVLTLPTSHIILDIEIADEGDVWVLTSLNGAGFIHSFDETGAHVSSTEIFHSDEKNFGFSPQKIAIDAGQLYLFGEYFSDGILGPGLVKLGNDLELQEITKMTLPNTKRFADGSFRNAVAYMGFGTSIDLGIGLLAFPIGDVGQSCFETTELGQDGEALSVEEGGSVDELTLEFGLTNVILERTDVEFTFQPLCHPLSSSTISTQNFTLYPNPVFDGTLHVLGLDQISSRIAEVWDVHGRMVYAQEPGNEINPVIHLPVFLTNGLYVLRFDGLGKGQRFVLARQ